MHHREPTSVLFFSWERAGYEFDTCDTQRPLYQILPAVLCAPCKNESDYPQTLDNINSLAREIESKSERGNYVNQEVVEKRELAADVKYAKFNFKPNEPPTYVRLPQALPNIS